MRKEIIVSLLWYQNSDSSFQTHYISRLFLITRARPTTNKCRLKRWKRKAQQTPKSSFWHGKQWHGHQLFVFASFHRQSTSSDYRYSSFTMIANTRPGWRISPVPRSLEHPTYECWNQNPIKTSKPIATLLGTLVSFSGIQANFSAHCYSISILLWILFIFLLECISALQC